MKEYFIERESLAELVDSLIAKKYPNKTDEELGNLRETKISQLDDKIFKSIMGSLDKKQFEELESMLKKPEATEADLKAFFKKHNIDLEKTITETMKDFAEDFLGGAK